MTITDAIGIMMGAGLAIDVMGTIFIGRGGVCQATCDQCNWKSEGTFLWCILRQSTHRCDDQLV